MHQHAHIHTYMWHVMSVLGLVGTTLVMQVCLYSHRERKQGEGEGLICRQCNLLLNCFPV